MDAVITYVDGLDPVWRKSFEQHVGVPAVTKHYRDWGTLKYLLRGIETHMPFIRNVFLVVSGETQVPEWADREQLRIVLHEDIIPREFLPVFNSTAIEMFLPRIPDIDEEILYFNDDFFPVSDCRAEDFFEDGKAFIKFSRHLVAGGMYKKHVRNSDALVRRALGRGPSPFFLRPRHSCYPMLRSESETLYAAMEQEILVSVTRIRSEKNFNGGIWQDWLYYRGKTGPARTSGKYFSLALHSAEEIAAYILSPKGQFACINDVRMDDEKFRRYRDSLISAFEKRFPKPSRFELLSASRPKPSSH